MKGNKLGVAVNSLARCSKHRLPEALKLFMAVDNARAPVTMGELSRFNEVRQSVSPNFNTGV